GARTVRTAPGPDSGPPDGLGPAGQALWEVFAGRFELEADELVALEQAARLLGAAAELADAVAAHGAVVAGSEGQPRLNPAVVELRAARTAVVQLLGRLRLPAEEGRPLTAAQRRAQHAARVRWAVVHAREGGPRGQVAG